MTELFQVIRMAYASTFADAVAAAANSHVEPALRHADGSLALDPECGLPVRVDLIQRRGTQAGKRMSVESAARMLFSVHTLPIPPAIVYVAPFVWDDVSLQIGGLTEQEAGAVLAPWFMDWFDAEDANSPNGEGLFGVVHYVSAPRAEAGMVGFGLDLGSAPAQALEDLLSRLASAGARDIRLA